LVKPHANYWLDILKARWLRPAFTKDCIVYCVTSSLPHAKRKIFNMHRSKEKKEHKYTKEDEDIYIAVL